ncbi:MraY family glycosyltransferase [Ideonella livida]|uniref:Glycosyl transferase n=1 Tax=Ideonella livida TaxID=2707176 RepID=A0A7C9TLJ6_9BURK|nr:glycosyltransferase [Ideonella livida]NDY91627.1 glycosyl transferase [Ideonella livida]
MTWHAVWPWLLVCLLASVAAVGLPLLLRGRRGRRWAERLADAPQSGPQKLHVRAVPRVGGLGLALGWAVAGLAAPAAVPALAEAGGLLQTLLLAGLPALCVGLLEDVSGRVSPRLRLLASAASAALAGWSLDLLIDHTGVPGLDAVAGLALGAWALTLLGVTGVSHAFNLIDGCHGLAGMTAVIVLATLGALAWAAGDVALAAVAAASVAVVGGFLVWNYPRGLVFLGDGGAYLLGFWVAELGLLLTHRQPQYPPLLPLALCFYPVFETLFSMWRRRRARRASTAACGVMQADALHLHSLVYRHLARSGLPPESPQRQNRRNAATAPWLWAYGLLTVGTAVLARHSTVGLLAGMAAMAGVYLLAYRRLSRATPVAGRLRGRRAPPLGLRPGALGRRRARADARAGGEAGAVLPPLVRQAPGPATVRVPGVASGSDGGLAAEPGAEPAGRPTVASPVRRAAEVPEDEAESLAA